MYNLLRRREKQSMACHLSYLVEEVMRMLLEQVYLLFVYILFIELVLVTVVAVALFIALIVIIRKLGKKRTSLSGR